MIAGEETVESAIGMSAAHVSGGKVPNGILESGPGGGDEPGNSLRSGKSDVGFWLARRRGKMAGGAATGLDQRRPIDLLTTPAGVELVEDFLGRIEYGVYT